MSKKVAIVLVNHKNYAEKYLADCINSLRAQQFTGQIKIFIVDNETSKESSELIRKLAPEAELILNKTNDGFAKGNNDAMKLALEQGFDYIILFNMDTVIDADCVAELVKVAEGIIPIFQTSPRPAGDPLLIRRGQGEVGAVQARLMMYKGEGTINSLGNVTHFLGFGYASGYKQSIENCKLKIENFNICYPSGAAVLFKAEVLKKVGLFDEEFWMYNEDQDLGWRFWLAGYKCVLAPEAVVYHKYEFNRSIKKYYFMDRNRIMAMLKNYHRATLVLISPAFIVMEIGLLFFSATGGWLKEKIEVYKYFFNAKNWQYIFQERKRVQKSRLIKDEDIVKMFSGRIWYQEIGDGRLKIANLFFNAYWQVAKFIIRW